MIFGWQRIQWFSGMKSSKGFYSPFPNFEREEIWPLMFWWIFVLFFRLAPQFSVIPSMWVPSIVLCGWSSHIFISRFHFSFFLKIFKPPSHSSCKLISPVLDLKLRSLYYQMEFLNNQNYMVLHWIGDFNVFCPLILFLLNVCFLYIKLFS